MAVTNEEMVSPTMLFICIIVSFILGVLLSYITTIMLARLYAPKKTLVLRDGQGRLEGIIET
jgi:hypothetical protein